MSEMWYVWTRVSSCFRAPKCNLCGEGHASEDCAFNSLDDSQRIYKCHNCKANNLPHNHKANDAECPMRSKYIEIKSNMNKRKSKSANNGSQNFAPLTRSFASVTTQRNSNNFGAPNSKVLANMQTQHSGVHYTQPMNNAYNNSNELFSFAEVSEILFNCINELQQCTSKLEQIKVIANLLNHVCK